MYTIRVRSNETSGSRDQNAAVLSSLTFGFLDGQISAVELKNEISSLLFRCLNGTNANIRYRTVKKEHEKTWMVPGPNICHSSVSRGEELASAKTAGKIYNSPSASGGIGVGGRRRRYTCPFYDVFV